MKDTFNSQDVSQFLIDMRLLSPKSNIPFFDEKKSINIVNKNKDGSEVIWNFTPCTLWQKGKKKYSQEEYFVNDWTFEWMEFLAQNYGQEYLTYLDSLLPVLQEKYREIQSKIMSTTTEQELRTLPECVLIKKLESCPNIGSTNDEDEEFEDFSGHQHRFDIKVYRYMEMIWNKIESLERRFSPQNEQDMVQGR
ncbi:MAG: hypothetical protein ACI4L7_00520 [Christensenellales bacterium]